MPPKKSYVTVNPRIKSLAQAMEIPINAVRAATEEADKVFRAQEIKIFSTEGASRGTPWPDLSEGYEKWKKKHYPGRKILQLTGQMRDAFTLEKDDRHVAEFFKVDSWVIRLGAQGPYYWDYHYKGGAIAGRPPQRNMLASDRESMMAMRKRVLETLRPYVQQQVRIIFQAGSFRG